MKLSIIIPVYNERNTIAEIIARLLDVKIPNIEKEIIVIDDGSSDDTAYIIKEKIKKIKNIKFIQHNKNQGKGAAVRTGIEHASGNYIIIQDADLEYNPQDIVRLIKPIQEGRAKVVYGTRLNRLPNLSRDEKNPLFLLHYFGNRFLSLMTSILYNQWITDMETCYKLFPKEAVSHMSLVSRGFEFEPEITSKLLKAGYKIYEIPISTKPRGYDEGKKLNTLKDGISALIVLLINRFHN